MEVEKEKIYLVHCLDTASILGYKVRFVFNRNYSGFQLEDLNKTVPH